jgi:hypothetical protein
MGVLEDYKSNARLSLMRVNDSLQVLALSYRFCNMSVILNEISWILLWALDLSLSVGELHGEEFLKGATNIEVSLARFQGEAEFLRKIYDRGTDTQRGSLPDRIASFRENFSEWLVELYPTTPQHT